MIRNFCPTCLAPLKLTDSDGRNGIFRMRHILGNHSGQTYQPRPAIDGVRVSPLKLLRTEGIL